MLGTEHCIKTLYVSGSQFILKPTPLRQEKIILEPLAQNFTHALFLYRQLKIHKNSANEITLKPTIIYTLGTKLTDVELL